MREAAEALLLLTASQVLRALREGLVVRALVWPGLVTALALIGSITGVAGWYASNSVAVSDAEVAELLRDEGLRVSLVDDPLAALEAGEVDRAAWQEGERWRLVTLYGGSLTLNVEAALRRRDPDAAWVIEAPPRQRRDRRLAPITRMMVGLLAVLFALYGVVFGAGSLLRDREDGTLEAERALPVRPELHAVARVLASSTLLACGFALSVGLLHGLLGVDQPWAWCDGLATAGLAGTSLGLALMARAGRSESLSGPLARGMTGSMLLLGLGWRAPEIGAYLPLASLGALVRGVPQSPVAWVVAGLLMALAAVVFERSSR